MPLPYTRLSEASAAEIVRVGQSPRYRELERLQSFYECKQYDGRHAWNDESVPLLERNPCVKFPCVAAAINSHTNFALGEGKFPAVVSFCNEDDSAMDGLNKADSATLDAFNARLVQVAKLEAACQQLIRMGQASRSVAVILGLRKGMPTLEPVWAKTATPTFDPQDPDEVVSLEIAYRYTAQERDPFTGEWAPVVYQYRRVINSSADTTFVPVRIQDKSQFPTPSVVDTVRTVKHGFGFCPVVWWKCLSTVEAGDGVDGHAVQERSLSAIEALDICISQRHRAALYAGDPQWFISGIDQNVPFAPTGRRAQPTTPDNPTGDPNKAGQWGGALFGAGAAGGVTKKGPGVVWSSDNPDAKASLVTLPGDALTSLQDHAADLLNKLSEAMCWVRIDPVALRGTADISAKAMLLMYAKQLSYVAQLRRDAGDKLILPILSKLYRIFIAKSDGCFVPGLKSVLGVLKKMQMTVANGETIWFAPKLKLDWSDYFEPSDLDEQTRVNVSIAALAAGVITQQSAVEHIKAVFNIADPGQYVEQLQKEKLQRQQDAVDNAKAMATTAPSTPPAQSNAPATKPQPSNAKQAAA